MARILPGPGVVVEMSRQGAQQVIDALRVALEPAKIQGVNFTETASAMSDWKASIALMSATPTKSGKMKWHRVGQAGPAPAKKRAARKAAGRK